MSDSVSSDAVPTVRATLERAGRTDRPKVGLPEDERERFPAGEVIRLALDGTQRHARVERAHDDSLEIRGAYDNARMARASGARNASGADEQNGARNDPEAIGDNRLAEWADDAGLDFGRSVHVDVVEEGVLYGLRAPGERAVYDAPELPDEGLAAIARDLEDRR